MGTTTKTYEDVAFDFNSNPVVAEVDLTFGGPTNGFAASPAGPRRKKATLPMCNDRLKILKKPDSTGD